MRVLLIGLGGCALFAAYICGLMWMISWMTGWRALARRFPASVVPQGTVYNWCSLRMWAFGGYNNALKVTLGEGGIYLIPMALFRLGHPPILFPWSVAGPMREWKSLGVTRWVLPLRVDNRTLELMLREDVRAFVDAHIGRKNDTLGGPFSNEPFNKR